MATITSSIVALLAAAPEQPEPETIPVPVVSARAEPEAVAPEAVEPETAAPGPEPGEPSVVPEPPPPAASAEAETSAPKPRPAPGPGETVIDEYGAVRTVPVRNIAGLPVPTALPTAYPEGPKRGLFADTYSRRHRYSARGGGPTPTGDWVFEYHGYFRAPMKLGVGARGPLEGEAPTGWGVRYPGQSALSLHTPTIPDDQYLDYAYTTHHPRDWAELYLTYGNGVVSGTVGILGFNFADAGWKEVLTQFGVAQAFVTMTPKLSVPWVKLKWKVGSFDNRYGASGRYDAGELETYLFGRTHWMGEALLADFTIKEDFTISVEHGIGATRPDPNVYDAAGFTVLHHAHVGFSFQNKLRFTVHWLNAFSREADRLDAFSEYNGRPAGREHIVGPELRIDWGRLGFMYAGFSYINLKNADNLARGIEVIHGLGSGQFRHGLNMIYLAGERSGEIFSVIAQFENSIQKIRRGSGWWGQGPDLTGKFYFMVNTVRTPGETVRPNRFDDPNRPLGGADGDVKYKIGFDLLGTILPWLGIGFRTTHVSPDSDYLEQAFTIFSPRLQFRTNFITHETVELQYSRYLYNQRLCPEDDAAACVQPPRNPVAPEGFGASEYTQDPGTRRGVALQGAFPYAPDANVVMLKISMWW